MPRKTNDITKSLASKLAAEVDIAVARVREAADKAVAAFELYAEKIANGEVAAPPVRWEGSTAHVTVTPEMLAQMGAPPEQDETPPHMRVAGFSNYQVTDSAAIKANMTP